MKKMETLNTVTSLTVNSVMDIFLQAFTKCSEPAVFETIFKNIFCQRVNQNTC